MSGYLTAEQTAQLLKAINPKRVQHLDGMSHLAAYDVRAHLNRVLGFARWSADVIDLALLFEDVQMGVKRTRKNGSTYTADIVSVGYRATLRLTVCSPDGTLLATYTEAATGDANNFPMTKRADAHDFAIKTAESQALKRCAANLGDQFGLSLYQDGSTAPIVGRTLVTPGDPVTSTADLQAGLLRVTPDLVPADVVDHTGEVRKSDVILTPAASPAEPLDLTAPGNIDALRAEVVANPQKAKRGKDDPAGDVFLDAKPGPMERQEDLAQAFISRIIGIFADATDLAALNRAMVDVRRQHRNGVISDEETNDLTAAYAAMVENIKGAAVPS